MLPFDSPYQDVPLQVEGLSIPRYGSLTINEHLAIAALITQSADSENPIAAVFQQLQLQQAIATLLLVSRVSPSWTLEGVQALEPETVGAIVEFCLNERERWGEQPKAEGKGRAIDWGELYWRVRGLYPNETRFSRENFGNCPIALVEQALEVARHREMERLSLEARAIANLGVLMAAANGVKAPKTIHFNDFEHLLAKEEARELYPIPAANSFMRLLEAGKLPEWVCMLPEVTEQMKLAADLEH